MALEAAGADPTNIKGRNLVTQLYQHQDMTKEGLAGPAWALLALDCANYTICDDALWPQERIIAYLIDQQAKDGSFPRTAGGKGDISTTALALTAFAPYQKQADVKEAVKKALGYLSTAQAKDGSLTGTSGKTCECARHGRCL